MSFRNPIIGANGTLIRNRMQSENYVTGVSGWRITRDGDAEFNDVVVRGEVDVQDPDGSRIHIYDEDPGEGAVIDLHPATQATAIDPARIHAGIFTNGMGNPAPFLDVHGPRFVTQPEFAPAIFITGRDATGADPREMIIFRMDRLTVEADEYASFNAPELRFFATDRAVIDTAFQDGDLMAASDTWNALGFNAGYSNHTAGYGAGYQYLNEHLVMLRGTIRKGTGAGGAGANGFAAGDIPMTLPAAIRPAQNVQFATGCQSRATNFGTARIQISSAGNLSFQTSTAHDPGWLELPHCIYSLT